LRTAPEAREDIFFLEKPLRKSNWLVRMKIYFIKAQANWSSYREHRITVGSGQKSDWLAATPLIADFFHSARPYLTGIGRRACLILKNRFQPQSIFRIDRILRFMFSGLRQHRRFF
jgi:hypothetical protein